MRRRLILAMIVLASSLTIGLSLHARAATSDGDGEWRVPGSAARMKNPVPADDQAVAAGKTAYVHQCRSCHGDSGRGDGPRGKELDCKPADLTDQDVAGQTDGALFWKISEGRTPMPAFEKLMPEKQRWQTVNYLRTLAPPATQPLSRP